MQSSYQYIHKPQLQGKEGYWLIINGAVIIAELPFQDNLKERDIFSVSAPDHTMLLVSEANTQLTLLQLLQQASPLQTCCKNSSAKKSTRYNPHVIQIPPQNNQENGNGMAKVVIYYLRLYGSKVMRERQQRQQDVNRGSSQLCGVYIDFKLGQFSANQSTKQLIHFAQGFGATYKSKPNPQPPSGPV